MPGYDLIMIPVTEAQAGAAYCMESISNWSIISPWIMQD